MGSLPAEDVVTRLRADVVVPYKEGYGPFRAPPSKLMTEAADEIERLRTIVRSINRIISRNEIYRWKVERIVAALGYSTRSVTTTGESNG